MSEPGQKGRYAADAFFFGDHNIQHRPAVRNCRRILRQASGGAAVALSKVQSVDHRMRLECGVGFRQLRTCRRTRPGRAPR